MKVSFWLTPPHTIKMVYACLAECEKKPLKKRRRRKVRRKEVKEEKEEVDEEILT